MKERPIINLVYEHLLQNQMFAVHRGPITVIATPLPVQGCDVYAYLNAYSFRGKQPGINVLLLFEPVIVLPGQYDKRIWDQFDYVITLYDALTENNPDKFRKIPVFRSDWLIEAPITESMIERDRLYPVQNRKRAICMIGGNKRSQVPGELYSRRIEAALWFQLYSDIPFDVYGQSVFPLPNYRGVLGAKEKFLALAGYRFCLCYENTNHPELARGYVEKIFDCLETRTIPIYLGCPDIEKYVPQDCFIDVRKFKSYRDLDDFLHAMDQQQYESYIRAIDAWVTQGGLRPYSMNATYTRLAEIYAASLGNDFTIDVSPAAPWEPGASLSIKDTSFILSPGTPYWSFYGLSRTASPLIDYAEKGNDPFRGTDDRLKKAQQLQKEKNYPEAVHALEDAMKDGFFNVDILYLYAQMLAAVSRPEESLTALLKVVTLAPDNIPARNDVDALFALKKDFKQAVQYLYSVITAGGNTYDTPDKLLALLASLSGNNENILFIIRSLLSQYPDDAKLEVILNKFNHSTQHVEANKSGSSNTSVANLQTGAHELHTKLDGSTAQTPLKSLKMQGCRCHGREDMLSQLASNGLWREGKPLRLHLGCGEKHFDEYINIDFPPSEHSVQTKIAADLFADITLLDFPALSVDEIRLHHVFEHFSRSKALALLIQWHCWLKIGGILYIETPDVIGSARTLMADVPYRAKQGVLRHAFGSHEASWAYHLDGWYKEKFEFILSKFGFSVQCRNVQWEGDPWLSNVHALAIKEQQIDRDVLLSIADEILLDSMVADVPGERLMHRVWCRMVRDELAKMHPDTDAMSMYADVSQPVEKVPSVMCGMKNRIPVTTVIFSKDRAMQLDATLRSLQLHCTDSEAMIVKVIYCASTALHKGQYEGLRQTHPSAHFIQEKNFKDDLLSALSHSEYAMFLVDDNLFIKDFQLADAVTSLGNCHNAIGFSFRLGENTTYCYMLGKQQNVPAFDRIEKRILRYDWTIADLDFGYPLELSSSLYRIRDIMPLLTRIDFKNPNTLELQLDTNKSAYASTKSAMLCFDQSVAFCNPVNMVQTMWANKVGRNNDYTAEKLADMFAQGYRIDVDRFSGLIPNSCHQEVPLEFTDAGVSGKFGARAVSPSRTPFVTIGIANWNGMKHIQLCLESIRRNTPERHEIIVVDNGSTDGSREYLQDQEDIILILNTENVGAPGARNQFLSISRGDYIVFLDNDTIVTKDWIKKLVKHMEADSQIGIIGACTNYATGLQGIAGVTYSRIEELEEYARKRAEEHRGELLPSPRLISFCVFIRRAAVEKIGAMETGFSKFCFEDDDYALRISIAGFKSVVANDVFIHHSGGPQGRGDKQYNQWLIDAWDGFKRKWALPQELPLGSGYDAEEISRRPFDLNLHYIPLQDPDSIKRLIWRPDSATEILQATVVSKAPALRRAEFTKGTTSIIIPAQSIHLTDCISSIIKYTDAPHEVIFLDHGAAAKVKKRITKAIKEIHHYKVIQIDRKLNFTQSINEGINQSTGEYIVLLFDDVIVGEGWLSDMLACLHNGKKIGIVGAMSNDASRLQRVEGIDFKSIEERRSFRERNRHRRIRTRNLDGFCMLFRRDLLTRIGLFDEIFIEDKYVFDDFCVMAVLEGFNNIIAGNVFVHNGGGINRLLSRDKTLFDEKWIGLDASTPLAEKVLIANAMETARSRYQKGAIEDAVNTLILRIGFSPNEKQLYFRLAEILLAENRFQDAIDALRGMSAAEDDAEYYALLGYGNEGLGSYQAAEEYVDKALAIDGKSPPALNLKGLLAYGKGDMSKAEELFRSAIEADPGYGDPYTNMGILRWKTEQKDEAVDLFETGFILSPDKGNTITVYYTSISSLERYERAENIFREARMAYPENKRILFLLIDVLLKQDKFQEAMKEVEKAMVHFGMDEGILSAALEIRRKIGAKSIAVKGSKEKPAATLSVCMIVKNEERHLAYCLNSLSPVADEMIVVDTGSTDKTKEIAEIFGAHIYDFEWINDFAAARNYSLSKAQGDWILVMDADEVISFQDHAKLRKLVNRKDKIAYTLTTRNYVHKTAGDGWTCNDNTYIPEQAGRGWFPSSKVRLFPNDKEIRFKNPIHELVEYSIQRIGLGRKESGIPVHHYGELDTKKATAKDTQYYELGVQKLKESGGNFRSVWELAVQAGELGKTEESIELWHKVLGFKQKEAAAYFNLANHYLQLGKYEDSYDCSRKSYALDPMDQSAVLSYAMSEFLAGDINKTISALESFLKGTDSQTSLVGLLAVSYLISGKKDRGLKYLRGLVRKKYDCVYYFKDLSQTLIAVGNLARAKSILTTAIEIKFYDQETLSLLAQCEAGAGSDYFIEQKM